MRAPATDRDRGSISVFAVVIAFAMIICVGLAVDLSGQVAAKQRAQSMAAQAARAGGEELDGAQAIRGLGVNADPVAARRAAQQYLASADLGGSARITGGTTLQVDTHDTYRTKFLSIIGISSLPATGHAEIRIVRVVEGVER